MRILSSLSPLALEHEGGTAVAMGFFDGIHIGHRAVINRGRPVGQRTRRSPGSVHLPAAGRQ